MAHSIYPLTHENILDEKLLKGYIYPNKQLNYYYSTNFDEKFYIDLALKGFITIWYKEDGIEYLLPEMQFEYAILDFENLHISKKVQKLLKRDQEYRFFCNCNYEKVISQLSQYHDNSWIEGKYIDLLDSLKNSEYKKDLFSLNAFGIEDIKTNKIIAGEIGYSTYKEKIYTSLSGFSSKEKTYNNYGNLQMVLLAQYLQKQNYKFWNLGHPYMDYKKRLGAQIFSRNDFIKRLNQESNL